MQPAERNYEIYDKELLAIVKAIFTRCIGNIQNLDRPQNFEVFPRASQTKWKASKMVSKVTRPQLHIMAHFRKDEHEGGYPFKKELSGYERRQ